VVASRAFGRSPSSTSRRSNASTSNAPPSSSNSPSVPGTPITSSPWSRNTAAARKYVGISITTTSPGDVSAPHARSSPCETPFVMTSDAAVTGDDDDDDDDDDDARGGRRPPSYASVRNDANVSRIAGGPRRAT
tara:strand:+ start:394 stop:795 length:402 start_codon:yes stop_codon:yes gene_type:complete